MTLELSNVQKAYGEFTFGPVDLSVGQEVLAVLGPSGSGKTTLLSLVAGITAPDAGSITLDGRELVGQSLEDRRVGLVFQEGALFPHMTARENIAYTGASASRVAELASLLELEDVLERRPEALSGGERQRVALARTLAADPDALLLDEPLSSLDAPIRRRLRDELHTLFAGLDIPICYVTHDQRTATALGDRVAIVHDGGLEQVASPAAVLDRPANRFVASFTGNENLLEGTVVGQHSENARVRVGKTALLASTSVDPGTAVTVCIHPSRIALEGPDTATDSETMNSLTGTVTRCLNEGIEYRVDVDIENGAFALTTGVHPTTVERLGLDTGSEVRVLIPVDTVHLLA